MAALDERMITPLIPASLWASSPFSPAAAIVVSDGLVDVPSRLALIAHTGIVGSPDTMMVGVLSDGERVSPRPGNACSRQLMRNCCTLAAPPHPQGCHSRHRSSLTTPTPPLAPARSPRDALTVTVDR